MLNFVMLRAITFEVRSSLGVKGMKPSESLRILCSTVMRRAENSLMSRSFTSSLSLSSSILLKRKDV